MWSGGVVASDPASVNGLGEDAFFDPLPVVLSASRLAQPLADAPGSVTVFDAEAIRRSGARDLADVLRMVPGFLVAHSVTGAPNAVYHGMTDENPRGLQILVDGRSQYSPLFFGGVAWNLIDVSLDDIERIEVIRGSNSAAYGSNAFLGVVNVITLPAADTQRVRVRFGQGNDGVADRHARVGMRLGDAFMRLSAEHMHDHGVRHFNDTRRTQRASLRADVPLGLSDELQFQAGVVDMTLDAGQSGDTRNPPHAISAAMEFVSAGWMRNTAGGGEVSLRYTRSQERYKDLFFASDPALDALTARLGLSSPFLVLIDQRIRTARDELEFQHTIAPTAHTRLVWGAGSRHDSVRAAQFYGTHKAVRQQVHRLFGNLEWRPAAWTVNFGATWENDSLSDTSLAPRLSANYQLSPQQTLRAGITRAHRIPTLTESRARTAYGAFDTSLLGLQAGVVPVEITRNSSGQLQQETIDVQEIGYLGDFRDQRVFLDLRVFREQVRDRIVPAILPLSAPNCELLGLAARRCGEARDYLNGQDLDIRGLEYQLRWRPRSSTELTLNQTWIEIDSRASSHLRVRDPAAAVAAERHMDHSAPDLATMLRWSERLRHDIELSVTYYRYGRFQWTPDSSVGPFERTDLRLAYPLRLGHAQGELALTVQGVGARRAEFRDASIGSGGASAAPQYLQPRGWVSLVLGF